MSGVASRASGGGTGMFQSPHTMRLSGVQRRKVSRSRLGFDQWQGDGYTGLVTLRHQRAQVGFTLDRPVGGKDLARCPAEAVFQHLLQMPGQRLADLLALCNRQGQTRSAQAGAFGLAPTGHVAGLFGIDGQRIEIARGDLGGRSMPPRVRPIRRPRTFFGGHAGHRSVGL